MTPVSPTLLLAALHTELAPLVRRLGLRRQGRLYRGDCFGEPVIATTTGIGRQRILTGVRTLLHEHQPRQVVLLGFAGGLDPDLPAGRVLRFGRVCNGNGAAIALEHGEPATLLTLDRLAATAAEKRRLFQEHRAAAVDMETFAVADILRKRGCRLTVIRAISDPADMCLPLSSLQWVTPTGQSRPILAAAWLFANPQMTLPMMTLWRHTRLAGRQLAAEVEQLLSTPGGTV